MRQLIRILFQAIFWPPQRPFKTVRQFYSVEEYSANLKKDFRLANKKLTNKLCQK